MMINIYIFRGLGKYCETIKTDFIICSSFVDTEELAEIAELELS